MDLLAATLAAEDARRYDPTTFVAASRHPSPIVRRHAALAMGRIGDVAALPALVSLLVDPDTTVRLDAVFALGELGTEEAVGRLRDLIIDTTPDRHTQLHAEAIAAVVKIGGSVGAGVLRDLLDLGVGATQGGRVSPAILRGLREAWRVGSSAPVEELMRAAEHPDPSGRRWAIYSLARIGHPSSLPLLMRATDDADVFVRKVAVRSLTAAYVNDAGGEPASVAARLRRFLDDIAPEVRIAAVRALATFADLSWLPSAIGGRVTDLDPRVRLEALAALATLETASVAPLLRDLANEVADPYRRYVLRGLARVEPSYVLALTTPLIRSRSWQERAAAAEVLAVVGGDTASRALESLARDADGRVVAQAAAALALVDTARARELAPRLLEHRDPVVRTFAAKAMAASPRRSDVTPLVNAYEVALRDSIPDARLAVIEALGSIARTGVAGRVAVEDELFRRFPSCDDYLVRRAAASMIPGSTSRWGPVTPIETTRQVGDYRDIARRLLLPTQRGERPPRVLVETDRGAFVVELFAADAPIAVSTVLRLTEQRFYDGQLFHRVVADFVAQTGDPRGDGWGGAGFSLRDELGRQLFEAGTLGLALFGPNTGGSQFFVTLSEQPHLEGTYPAIGRVTEGLEVLSRVIEGDRVRSVRRQ